MENQFQYVNLFLFLAFLFFVINLQANERLVIAHSATNKLLAGEEVWRNNFFGRVSKRLEGKEYILIIN